MPSGRMPHPGRTLAQRRALDAIGCGNHSPPMAKRVRDALLKAELIIPIGDRVIGSGTFAVRISQYEMPIPVHMQWCSAVAATDEEMAALGAGLEGLV